MGTSNARCERCHGLLRNQQLSEVVNDLTRKVAPKREAIALAVAH